MFGDVTALPLMCCVHYSMGKTSIPAPCKHGILMAGHVKLSVPYLALDVTANGMYNCADGASPAYEVDAFVGELLISRGDGGSGVGFIIHDVVVHVEVDNGTMGEGSVGAWAANVSGVAEVAAGDGVDGMPGIDMSITFDAVLTGDGFNNPTNTSAFDLVTEVTGEFVIGNDDFEVHGLVNFEYPCTSGFVYATAGLNLNTSYAMRVDGAEVLVTVACDKDSLPEVGRYQE